MTVLNVTNSILYPTLSAAIAASAANDLIQLSAGSYIEDFPDITHNLTINGIGGLASLARATPLIPAGRAVLNVPFGQGANLTISGLEISGAARPGADPNGAGILFEIGNGNLTITNSWIHNNEDGILTGGPTAASPAGEMNVTINHSEISDNGAPVGSFYAANGKDHNIYAGTLTNLTITDSYIHSVFSQGHEIKSRALSTTITNNRIFDLSPTTAGALGSSYSIDVPLGGNVVITGNIIEKGPQSVNRYVIHFGGEGVSPTNSLQVCDNTIVNHRSAGATAVYNQLNFGGANIAALICDNTLYDGGGGFILVQDSLGVPVDITTNNVILTGNGPILDTRSLFEAPEPASVAVLLFAALSLAIIRIRRGSSLFHVGGSDPLAACRTRAS